MKTLINQTIKVFILTLFMTLSGCIEKDDESDNEGAGPGGGGGSQGSVNFDGTNEYLTLSDAWYAGDSTICLWMRPDVVDSSGSSGHTLFSMSNVDKYFYLSFDNNDIDFNWEDSADTDCTINAAYTFTANNVYQVCTVIDHGGTGSRVYVNGAVVTNSAPGNCATAMGAGVAGAFTTLTIGHEPAPSFQTEGKTQSFDGVIDNFMIWNFALPANAIAQLYNGGQGFDPTFAFGNYTAPHVAALNHWYRMGDETGDIISGGSAVINDVQGNENLLPVNFESTDFAAGLW